MARLAGVICPFLIESDIPLPTIGFILLFVHGVTVFTVYHVPETKGEEMGHALDHGIEKNGEELMEVPVIS